MQDLGFQWVKQNIAWRDIESQQKGRYEWELADNVVRRVGKRGLKLIVRIDRQPFWSQAAGTAPLDNAPPANLADFGDFCYQLASHYKGKIAAYQVWNEPNLAREWGNQLPNPEQYVELLKVCYTGIKAADPDALVISASMAPTGTRSNEAMPDDEFVERMYRAGAAPSWAASASSPFATSKISARSWKVMAMPASRLPFWSSAGRPIRIIPGTHGTR